MTTTLDFPHIPPVDTAGMDLPINRKFLTRVASFVNTIAEDTNLPDWQRNDALSMFYDLSEVLSFTEGCSGNREHQYWMAWPQVATCEVDQFVDQLPPEVVEANPIYVEMAYRMAKLVDTPGFATDFRYEALAQLDHVLNRLKKLAKDFEEAAND